MQHFANYELVRLIAVGGMGEVYLARQRTAFGREVAVKIIRPDLMYDVVARKRFQREAEVSSYLNHENILPMLEFNEEDGRLFIVTPYMSGGTLGQRMEQGSLTISEIHEIYSSLLGAVAYLHKRGVIHRDLKPGNILFEMAEGSSRINVRLIDFGIAALQGQVEPLTAPLSDGGKAMGTAAYMAPERFDGVAAPSNDIYSLGVILHLMLTGQFPGSVVDPSQVLPQPLLALIQRCIADDPADRYACVEDLLGDFENAYKALTSTRLRVGPPSSPPATRKKAPLPQVDSELMLNVEADDPVIVPVSSIEPARSARASSPEHVLADSETEANTGPQGDVAARVQRGAVSRASRTPGRKGSGIRPSVPPSGRYTPTHITPENLVEDDPVSHMASEKIVPRSSRSGPERPLMARSVQTDLNVLQDQGSSEQRGEVRLPPLPGKNRLSGDDFNAPTSFLDKANGQHHSSSGDNNTFHPTPRPKKRFSRRRRKRALSLFVFLTACILIIGLIISGISYAIVQLSISAHIAIGPKIQSVSGVFTITAQPESKSTDVSKLTVPANVFVSTSSGSQQGQTTGVTGCVLSFLNCKPQVSYLDVTRLSDAIRPGLQTKITQDLNQKMTSSGDLKAGTIFFSDSSIQANPPVGSNSQTVTVNMTEQGSLEYVKTQDVQNLARTLLTQKLRHGYALISSMTRVGQPVVRNVSSTGVVTLAVAAASIERYQISSTQMTDIQNHVKGMKPSAAKAWIDQNQDIDPTLTTVSVSYGDTIPTNTSQISLLVVDPTNLPAVQLPSV